MRDLLQRTGLKNKAAKIYYLDKKGCCLTFYQGAKRVHLVAQEHAENVTIVARTKDRGQAILPAILFKGKWIKPTYSNGLPTESKVMIAPKGSVIVKTFNSWIDHLVEYKSPPPVILIFDGVKCLLDITIVKKVEAHGIHLYCLPSNTTHELQPMDKALFRQRVFARTMKMFYHPSLPSERLQERAACNEFPSEFHDKTSGDNDSECDSDDYLPLSVLRQKLRRARQNSFSEVLSTPDMVKQRSRAVERRKTINYKAIEMKRWIFLNDAADSRRSSQKTAEKPTTVLPKPTTPSFMINET
ncbi:hypothetical protein ILUMI_26828 [Ignelater luminosus]|uniref:DDE-1 domain-containing protein n=1 Tax=Ignelater luminosus TaxID=2038154 RepID=A0A8K0C5U7_IGNLU|nr:hypothetical protein ILUMI_26828 [Ignelater luminosus]